MLETREEYTANEAWRALLERYDIVDKIDTDGIFHITAEQIKQYKEPRLMAKWDSSASLPDVFKEHKINILPESRSSYVLGDFLLYQEIPELEEKVEKMIHVDLPEYESIDLENISSEANAINVLVLSGILDDFLETDANVATFNGRMGTGIFDFSVDTYRRVKRNIHVTNAQCEIDGGFENSSSVVIMEAKNVIHKDFHIRQLYYPYRLWQTKVNKPIRLVFSIYSNQIFRLFEYRFADLEDFSSIELVKTKNYSLQDTTISIEDLMDVREKTDVITTDDMEQAAIPFIQANSMDRIISLMENMYDNPMTAQQIAELMKFEVRQAHYYTSAGRYLGLFGRHRGPGQTSFYLTRVGQAIYKSTYKERQLSIVELMLQHEIFAFFFDRVIESGELPTIEWIERKMRDLNVCGEPQIARRATSVYGWLKWMFNLTRW